MPLTLARFTRSITCVAAAGLIVRTLVTPNTTLNLSKRAMSTSFFEAVEARRSYYNITDKSTVSDEKLQEIVESAIKYSPTSFNSQSSRAVLVLGEKNKKFWDAVFESHIKALGGDAEQIAQARSKFDIFQAGYGSVIFFEDQTVVDGFVSKMPALAHAFPVWSANSAGIAQYIVWTALAAEGLGANLQHYAQFSPDTQSTITEFLGVPATWISTALLPFGVASGPPGRGPKAFQPIEDRVKVLA